MFRVTINGQPHECEPGQSLLVVARAAGADVPALCADPRLAPVGGCRLCLVEVDGQPRPVTACTTLAERGLNIRTHTPELEQLRRTQLRLLARHYPAPHGAPAPLSPFEKLIRAYGLEDELGAARHPGGVDDSHPCIHVDMARCVDCFRCVRICDEVAGRFVWRAWNRGNRTVIAPADGTNLRDSACVSCGACVDTCPSGAIRDQSALLGPFPTAEVRTVCPYCGTGCEMHVGRDNGRLVSVRPAIDAPVNRGHLCVKGRYGWDFVHARDRITEPLIRAGDGWRTVTWDEALALVADRLRDIQARCGPDAVGLLGSARATNEENYVAQKFARVALGTNNVDCCARVCHAPTAAGMRQMLGTGASTNSFADIEQSRAILLCGANPTENHPIVGDRIRQATRHGAALIVIDPRQIELARSARVHLPLRPGTNIPLLNALAHVIVEEELFDASVVPRLIDDWEAYRQFIAGFAPEQVASECGVSCDAIRAAARLYAACRPAMSIHGLGVTEHVQGTEGVMCLVNLAILTGNLGRPGTGVNPLRGQNNVQGAAHMGCEPANLTGGAPLADHRGRFEAAWNAPIPQRAGLNLMQMCDAAEAGTFRALWAVGYDVALTNPNSNATVKALRALELVVVQDLFLTETARAVGTVFLPACSSFEKDGTFMNSERRIQRVRRVIEPLGQSRTDWEILCDAARALGHGRHFDFHSAEDIWNEIRVVWPAAVGITYSRLEQGGLQWPCPAEDHPGTPFLHGDVARGQRRLTLRQVAYRPTPERTTPEFPLLLVTGRALYQFNAGTMTARSKAAAFQPDDMLHVSTADARRLGIATGQIVQVRSRHGAASLPALVTDAVKSGELFATFQSARQWINHLTSPHRDAIASTPEYKVCAVRVEPQSIVAADS